MIQKNGFLLIVVALTLLLSTAVVFAQTDNLTHTIAWVAAAPDIDGNLTDRAWIEASQKGSKVVVDLNDSSTQLTPYPRVTYLAYDDDAIYVAVRSFVPDPETLVTDAAEAYLNDEMEVFLGPASGGYHQIIVTAGAQVAVESHGRAPLDMDDLTYAVEVGDIQWVVELAIPFEALGEKPSAGDQWKLNLNGHQIGAGSMWLAWNPTYGIFHNPNRFATLIFGD